MNVSLPRSCSWRRALLSLPILVGLAAAPLVSHAQVLTLYDGAGYTNVFGNAPASLDTSTWSPNSDVEQSLKFSFTANWQNNQFVGNWNDYKIAPIEVSFDTGLRFDYSTTNTPQIEMRLYLSLGSTNKEVLSWKAANLVTDGQWHTAVLNFTDWNQQYYDLVAAGDINPSSTYTAIVGVRSTAAGMGTSVNIDNVTLSAVSPVPEPSTYALIAGLGMLGFLGIRRAKKTRDAA